MSRDFHRAFTRFTIVLGLAVACGVTEFALPGSEDTTTDDSTSSNTDSSTVDDDTSPMDDDVGEDGGSDADLPSDDNDDDDHEPSSLVPPSEGPRDHVGPATASNRAAAPIKADGESPAPRPR